VRFASCELVAVEGVVQSWELVAVEGVVQSWELVAIEFVGLAGRDFGGGLSGRPVARMQSGPHRKRRGLLSRSAGCFSLPLPHTPKYIGIATAAVQCRHLDGNRLTGERGQEGRGLPPPLHYTAWHGTAVAHFLLQPSAPSPCPARS